MSNRFKINSKWTRNKKDICRDAMNFDLQSDMTDICCKKGKNVTKFFFLLSPK